MVQLKSKAKTKEKQLSSSERRLRLESRRNFTTEDIARATGVHPATIHRWCHSKLLHPSVCPGIRGKRSGGAKRIFNVKDKEICILISALKRQGLSIRRIKQIVGRLTKLTGWPIPLQALAQGKIKNHLLIFSPQTRRLYLAGPQEAIDLIEGTDQLVMVNLIECLRGLYEGIEPARKKSKRAGARV